MASRTSGFHQLRSGCSGVNECRYHWPVASSKAQALPARGNELIQLLGGEPSGRESAQTYQSRLGLSLRGARRQEPGVLVGGVVGDQVDHHPDAAGVRLGDQPVEVVEGAEDGVDVGVVGDVVAEVGHRRRVERRQPDGVHPQRPGGAVVQVVEPGRDPGQVAHAVAVRVGEAARVDLVDDPVPPPVGCCPSGGLPQLSAPAANSSTRRRASSSVYCTGGDFMK